MRQFNGWWLPNNDTYFDSFLEGLPPKQNGFQREHLMEALKYVKRSRIAVDVGAHVGFWAKDMADQFDKVYCFEPSPETFGCLAKNLANYDNVELSCVAIGDKQDRCIIRRDHDRANNSGSEYVTKAIDGPVRMVSLDKLDIPGCDFLKIDVEGFELAVLRGAKKLISRFRPVISMECCKKFAWRRYQWHDLEAEHFLISKRGYREVACMRPDKVFVPT